MTTTTKGWTVVATGSPLPVRDLDYAGSHDNYDGAEDAADALHNRTFTGPTERDVWAQIWEAVTNDPEPCCVAVLDDPRDASCVFGCGSVVDSDTMMCSQCRDHSANRIECPDCGQAWENWSGDYEACQ